MRVSGLLEMMRDKRYVFSADDLRIYGVVSQETPDDAAVSTVCKALQDVGAEWFEVRASKCFVELVPRGFPEDDLEFLDGFQEWALRTKNSRLYSTMASLVYHGYTLERIISSRGKIPYIPLWKLALKLARASRLIAEEQEFSDKGFVEFIRVPENGKYKNFSAYVKKFYILKMYHDVFVRGHFEKAFTFLLEGNLVVEDFSIPFSYMDLSEEELSSVYLLAEKKLTRVLGQLIALERALTSEKTLMHGLRELFGSPLKFYREDGNIMNAFRVITTLPEVPEFGAEDAEFARIKTACGMQSVMEYVVPCLVILYKRFAQVFLTSWASGGMRIYRYLTYAAAEIRENTLCNMIIYNMFTFNKYARSAGMEKFLIVGSGKALTFAELFGLCKTYQLCPPHHSE